MDYLVQALRSNVILDAKDSFEFLTKDNKNGLALA